jgi:uncharacterized membrane protein YeaQ/YmgE (transglycosylase-associated protein family)
VWSRRGCAGEDLPPAKETLSATPSRRDQLLLMECAFGNDAVTNARDTRIGPDEFLQRGDRRATSKRDNPWHIPLRPYMLESDEGGEDWGAENMHILWIILIGFIAGVIAKLVTPGENEPKGFILTTALGIIGAFVATYLGQAIGWYGPDQGAGLIGAIVGAVLILLVWGYIERSRQT